jgi:hypothetical protein
MVLQSTILFGTYSFRVVNIERNIRKRNPYDFRITFHREYFGKGDMKINSSLRHYTSALDHVHAGLTTLSLYCRS